MQALFERLRSFDTALLANTIGYIDPTPVHEWYMDGSIRCLTPSRPPTVGVAVTAEIDSSTPLGTADFDEFYRQVEAMEHSALPSVWVVKAVGSRPGHECIMGDGMAKLLRAAGCAGAVIEGGVRDVPGILGADFGVHARGTVVHHCALRMRRANEPVEVGGITIHPGDCIHAGAEGVIRIPASCMDQLPDRALAMIDFERDAHEALVRRDLTVAQRRAKVGELLAAYGFVKSA
ncbi:MAG: RraA family protein [Bryobacteraceae bacterium]